MIAILRADRPQQYAGVQVAGVVRGDGQLELAVEFGRGEGEVLRDTTALELAGMKEPLQGITGTRGEPVAALALDRAAGELIRQLPELAAVLGRYLERIDHARLLGSARERGPDDLADRSEGVLANVRGEALDHT